MITEYDLEADTVVPAWWGWFFVLGVIALLTGAVLPSIIAILWFGYCVVLDIADARLEPSR